jgi:hypothetical protein
MKAKAKKDEAKNKAKAAKTAKAGEAAGKKA